MVEDIIQPEPNKGICKNISDKANGEISYTIDKQEFDWRYGKCSYS